MKRKRIIISCVLCLVVWLSTAIRFDNTKFMSDVGLSDETLNKVIVVKKNNYFLTGFEQILGFDNAITNTNLFSIEEQALLEKIQSNLTANTMLSSSHRDTNNNGYDLYIERRGVREIVGFKFCQIKHGLKDGLVVKISEGRCLEWMRYSNGLAVDKWLLWDKDGNLFRYIVFKEPFNFQQYTHWKFKVQISKPWPWKNTPNLAYYWP